MTDNSSESECKHNKQAMILKSKIKLWFYLFLDVYERGRVDHRKANKVNIRLRVTKGPQTVIIFLTSCVKKSQSVRFPSNHNSYSIVIEDL